MKGRIIGLPDKKHLCARRPKGYNIRIHNMALRLTYQTGIATTIQFITLTVLNFISGTVSSVDQCFGKGSGCAGDVVLQMGYFIVISIWFGALWLAGFAAQDRRSRRISQLLILAEGMVLIVGLFGLTHSKENVLAAIISFVEIVSSAWVAWLAFRLMRAKGGRVRVRSHIHHHRRPVER